MAKIIVCGPGAGGKDYARKIFVNQGFKYGISYTSRAPRPGEINNVDYYFLTKEDFEQKIKDGFWIEYDKFGENYYGTSKKQFEAYNLFIMTRNGISQLRPEDRAKVTVIYFDIDEKLRRERMKKDRNWSEQKINNRIEDDRKEFEGFVKPEYDIRITNPDF